MNHQYHLGLNLGHERSVAIVRDGKIEVAIEQERLDRNKFSLGYLLQSPGDPEQMQLPLEAIRYCLDACKIHLADLATITANMPGEDQAPQILHRSLPPEVCDRIQQIPSHHLAHAYSAYSPSGFEEALIWVADASGSTQNYRTESYSLYLGQGSTITPLHTETVEAHLSGIGTLGFLYEYITQEAGFVTQVSDRIKHSEAGKLMGLAPFGRPQPHWHQWIKTRPESYSLDLSPYDIFLEVEAIKKSYDTATGKPYLRAHIVDLAYKVQQELEQAILHIVNLAIQRTGIKKLCIAGGVGLNSVANYKLLQTLQLEDVFVFPAAGDSGIAAGCAYWAHHVIEGNDRRQPLHQAGLGRSYTISEMEQAIDQFSDQVCVQVLSNDEILDRAATVLAEGSIVARYDGGSEFGPRALGQRSIIADPTFLKMKDIINARVKFREAFRPFAPVIPLEAMSEVFEQEVAAPFMLLVSPIKAEYHDQIPAVTHVDGTGRVQSVTADHNPFFYQLCYRLVEKRSGPPVLLNTSFNVAGQPIVETPAEAIATFLNTDIDFLALGNYWIAKQHVPVLKYADHLQKIQPSPTPEGLGIEAPAVTHLMQALDRAIFEQDYHQCPWTPAEVQKFAAKIAQYKETSQCFPDHPYPGMLKTRLSDRVVLLLNPQAHSVLVNRQNPVLIRQYNHRQTQLLLANLQADARERDELRLELRMTQREFAAEMQWATQELAFYQLQPLDPPAETVQPDSPMDSFGTETLAPFQDPTFSARKILEQFYQCLKQAAYTEVSICQRLQLESLQQIQPTHLHYYDRHYLSQDRLSEFIRLFQLRSALSRPQLVTLFGEDLFICLCQIGLLIPRQDLWASRVDIFDVTGLLIATDHRYMLLAEDQFLTESPVMYIGMDSMGLVHTAPQYDSETLLDLCCGSGIQGLCATRYARSVIGVDINPRAIRFSRFNAQLNGIENIEFRLGNLYATVPGERFNTILANPPFVPSPNQDFKFRDGGANGEEVLAAIVQGSAAHLCSHGRLHIVTDLVDVETYGQKLADWWQGDAVDQLVLGTADRNDILFSVPHSHAAFGQSYQDYCAELEQWLTNFHQAKLTAVNFGYILMQQNPTRKQSTYYFRTIHNPDRPIYAAVKGYFQQRERLNNPYNLQLCLNADISMRTEWGTESSQSELFSSTNPYYTTYPISDQVLTMLQEIQGMQPLWQNYVNLTNQDFIQELIFKGILELQGTPANSLPIPWSSIPLSSWPSMKPSNVSDRLEQPLTIRELQTKTTPTCLSSYL